MRSGEIYLAAFPFGDVPGMKLRPVLLLTASMGLIPEVLVAYISSVIPEKLLESDLLLDPSLSEFRNCNLKVKSVLRLHKLATIHCSSLVRQLGTIDFPQQATVSGKLRTLLAL